MRQPKTIVLKSHAELIILALGEPTKILCAGPVAPDAYTTLNRSPNKMANRVSRRSSPRRGIRPFPATAAQRGIQLFGRGLIVGEVAACANGAAEFAVETLDPVGGVDDPSHLRRKGAKLDDPSQGSVCWGLTMTVRPGQPLATLVETGRAAYI
jgi:hypothetical protein